MLRKATTPWTVGRRSHPEGAVPGSVRRDHGEAAGGEPWTDPAGRPGHDACHGRTHCCGCGGRAADDPVGHREPHREPAGARQDQAEDPRWPERRVDRERIGLLAEAVAPRVAALAGALFDRDRPSGPELVERAARCLALALAACVQDRPLTDRDSAELALIGRQLAESGGRSPSLVGMHSVLLLGHSEALRQCQYNAVDPHFAARLEAGAERLLTISEAMTADIAAGWAAGTGARGAGAGGRCPVEALCALVTEPMNTWRQPYLLRMVRDGGLDTIFPAVLAVAGRAPRGWRGGASIVRFGRRVEGLVAVVGEDEHALMLCPADGIDAFRSWIRRSVDGPVVLTRAVGLEEVADRYRSTLDVLPLSGAGMAAESMTDARHLLWHRMLASQRTGLVTEYIDEVIGPVLRLPAGQRDDLLETLTALERHSGSVRAAADSLAVHEKTVRHRLHRVEALTGLNALNRTDWPPLNQAVQLAAMFPVTGDPANRGAGVPVG